MPLAPDDTRLSFRYDINGTVVVSPALSPLNITSNYDSFALGLSRPFYRTPEATLTLGTSFEVRRAQTFLLGMPFSFTAGSSNGVSNVTALRLYGEWIDRDADHALALRSTVSFGLDALGATDTGTGAEQQLRVVARAGAIRAPHLQGLGSGGSRRPAADRSPAVPDRAVRARRHRHGARLSRIPDRHRRRLLRLRRAAHPDRHAAGADLADTEDAGKLQIVPFYDYGRGWNVDRTTPYPPEISGAGAGLRWNVGSGILAEIYYARALRNVRAGTSLQDRGIYFRLTTKVF